MEVCYRFVNQNIFVETDERTVAILAESDKAIARNDRRETRRHFSYNAICKATGNDFELADRSFDIERNYIEAESYRDLINFIRTLTSGQQRVADMLEKGETVDEIARRINVSAISVYQIRNRLRQQIKKYLKQAI